MATKKFTHGFRFYQKIGGNEQWELLRADLAKWDEIKPTFMSVLRLDKAYRSDSNAAQWAEARYAGPMYFDFDDADDPVAAVRGAVQLLKLLENDDVPPDGCDIFLSGGKGVHITIPVHYFVDGLYEGGSEPFELNLPLAYKEIAYKYATPCIDFRVYSQKSGRMWRTHYNQRENGLYKVQVTYEELCSIKFREDYVNLCSSPRPLLPKHSGKIAMSARLSTIYSEAVERTNERVKAKAKAKSARDKLPTMQQVKGDKESFELVASGGNLKDDRGWNHIALQLCLYAQHYRWSVGDLVAKVTPLLKAHESDSYRYNSVKKRTQELERMFDYVTENPSYEYQYGGLNHLLAAPPTVASEGEHDNLTFDPALQINSTSICAETEHGVKAIANFGLTNCRSLMSVDETSEVFAAAFDLSTRNSAVAVDVNPQDFTGSARLQVELSKIGGVFVGSDAQARGLYHIVSSASQAKAYVVDKAGLNIIRFTLTNSPTVPNLYPVWMDDNMIVSSAAAENVGLRFEHRPNMAAVHTDLSKAHQWSNLLAQPKGRETVLSFFRNLFKTKRPAVMGKLLGWYVACFYKQLFQHYVGSFPLLHIYGVAGAGKTETQRLLLRLFSVDEPPTETSPGTSVFAFVRLLSSSASIPVLLDEWKPSEYKESQIGDYRGIMRECYNQKPWVRAGAAGKRDSWSGLTKFFLAAPLVYVGEAAESQTAIVERSVMVGFSRASDQEQAASYRAFLSCSNDMHTLPSLGRFLAGSVLSLGDLDNFHKEFSVIRDAALERNTLSLEDLEAHKRGEMTDEEYQHRSMTKIRTMLGACTVEYGLRKLQQILQQADLGPEMQALDAYFEEAYSTLYVHDGSADLAVPEYVKVLTSMADVAKWGDEGFAAIELGTDYTIVSVAGKQVLRLTLKSCWLKYVKYLRELGLKPMFSEAVAFQNAMKNTHHYISAGKDPQTSLEFVELDYDSLLRSGCGEFPVKKFRR